MSWWSMNEGIDSPEWDGRFPEDDLPDGNDRCPDCRRIFDECQCEDDTPVPCDEEDDQ